MLQYRVDDNHYIRVASDKDDAAEIAVVMEFAIKDSPMKSLLIDPMGLYEVVKEYLNDSQNKTIILLVNKGGYILGLLMGEVTTLPRFKQPTKIASETIWWVDSSSRGHGGVKLLEAFELWAGLRECQYISMSSQNNPYMDRLARLYANRGYEKMEEHYLKKVKA